MIDHQRPYHSSDTLRTLIRDNNMLLMVLSRFNIPFGFGDATVGRVCETHAVDAPTFLAVCNLLSGGGAEVRDVNLPSLMDYLRRAHGSFLEVSLPRIRQHLIEAINHNRADEVSLMLMKFFDDYVEEVKRHMEHENNEIFGYVDGLLAGKAPGRRSIADFSANHSHTAAKLQELKDLFIYHYNQAENSRMSFTLFDIIMCEKDLMAHFEVESRLFIPAVELLEKSRRTAGASATAGAAAPAAEADPSPLGLLGDREKEILSCVAKGMANKEIADRLCISIHTVTTHRRNICAKLDIHSAAGLTIFAILHGLVTIDELSSGSGRAD